MKKLFLVQRLGAASQELCRQSHGRSLGITSIVFPESFRDTAQTEFAPEVLVRFVHPGESPIIEKVTQDWRKSMISRDNYGRTATARYWWDSRWLVLWRTQANTTRTSSLLHRSGGVLGHPPLSGQDTPEAVYRGHKGIVLLARWSRDGKYIATGSTDGTAQIWLAATRATKLSVRSTTQPPLSDDYPWSLSWSPSHPSHLAVGFADGTIQVLDADGGQRLSLFNPSLTGAQVIRVAWSPDERYLAAGGSDNLVRVYRYPGWEVVTAYGEHTNTITALAWSPDGKALASGSEDTTARVWEPLSGKTRLVYQGHSDRVASLSWSPDSTHIVSTSGDNTVKVWNVVTRSTDSTYNNPGGAPLGEAAWSHNGHLIAVYGGDAKLHLLDAQTGKEVRSYFTGVSYGLDWSPDDTRIVTGSYDALVRIWRVG